MVSSSTHTNYNWPQRGQPLLQPGPIRGEFKEVAPDTYRDSHGLLSASRWMELVPETSNQSSAQPNLSFNPDPAAPDYRHA